jgi:glycosyltransferase involved in cell wall biosynthesis
MTKENLKILLVIPTYNNRSSLAGVVEKALQTPFPVLVVNDGSTDGAMETLPKHACLHVAGWNQNRGKGAALLEAARWAMENGFTHIITLDADGQHDPADAEKLARAAKSNSQSIVLGHRVFNKQQVPLSSRFGRKFSNFWVWVSTGLQLQDTQCGYRAYPVTLMNKLKFKSRHYNFEVEVLVRGIWAGMDVVTVDISVKYDEGTRKASHFRPFVDNARISITYTTLVTRNFLPLPHKTIFETEAGRLRRISVKAPKKSLKVLFTEATSPREITLASMLGVFLGTLPLVSIHSIAIIFAATRLRLNRLIALNISHFCAPPFVPVLAFEIGYYILHKELLYALSFDIIFKEIHLRFIEYLLGAVVFAPFLALITGFFVYIAVSIWFWLRSDGKQVAGKDI